MSSSSSSVPAPAVAEAVGDGVHPDLALGGPRQTDVVGLRVEQVQEDHYVAERRREMLIAEQAVRRGGDRARRKRGVALFVQQLRVLCWKHTLQYARHAHRTVLAFFALPCLLLLLLALVKSQLSVERVAADLPAQWIPSVMNPPDTVLRTPPTAPATGSLLALQQAPTAQLCGTQNLFWRCIVDDATSAEAADLRMGKGSSKANCNVDKICQPMKIAVIGNGPDLHGLAAAFVRYEEERFVATATANASDDRYFTLFPSMRAFEDTIKHDSYGEDQTDTYSAAIEFTGGMPDWAYTLRLNQSKVLSVRNTKRNLPRTSVTFDNLLLDSSDSPADDEDPFLRTYVDSGIFAVQSDVHSFILRNTTVAVAATGNSSGSGSGSGINVNVSDDLVRVLGAVDFPFQKHKKESFWNTAGATVAIFIIAALLYPLGALVRELVTDKERGTRELLLVMGLNDNAYVTSWVFIYVVQFSTLAGFLMLICTTFLFTHSSSIIIFVIFECFFLASISFGFLLAAVFWRARTASLASSVLYVAGYFLSVAINPEVRSARQVLLASLHPAAAFSYATAILVEYEEPDIGVTLDTYERTGEFSVSMRDILAALIFDTLYLALLAWYSSHVIPSPSGARRSILFFLQPSFWHCWGIADLYDRCLAKLYCYSCCCSCCGERGDGHRPLPVFALPTAQNVGGGRSLGVSQSSAGTEHHASLSIGCSAGGAGPTSAGMATEAAYDDPHAITERVSDALLGQIVDGTCVRVVRGTKVYGSRASGQLRVLDDLSVDFFSGQITAFLGHNGAGKSTTMKVLTGITPLTHGEAWVCGRLVSRDMDRIRSDLIGVCPQENIFYGEDMTSREWLWLVAAGCKGMSWGEIDAAVATLLAEVGLRGKEDCLADQLSGGQKRKLCLAAALVGGSQVLFLDEPTAGLDPYSRRFVYRLIQRHKRNKVVVLTTHHMEEAELLGDRIAILDHGRLLCSGSALFLRSFFGVGYHLVVEKTSRLVHRRAIEAVIQRHVPQAQRLTTRGTEITYQLPLNAASKFGPMFHELDDHAQALGVKSYGTAVTSLEDVFLRIDLDGAVAVARRKRVARRNTPKNGGPRGSGNGSGAGNNCESRSRSNPPRRTNSIAMFISAAAHALVPNAGTLLHDEEGSQTEQLARAEATARNRQNRLLGTPVGHASVQFRPSDFTHAHAANDADAQAALNRLSTMSLSSYAVQLAAQAHDQHGDDSGDDSGDDNDDDSDDGEEEDEKHNDEASDENARQQQADIANFLDGGDNGSDSGRDSGSDSNGGSEKAVRDAGVDEDSEADEADDELFLGEERKSVAPPLPPPPDEMREHIEQRKERLHSRVASDMLGMAVQMTAAEGHSSKIAGLQKMASLHADAAAVDESGGVQTNAVSFGAVSFGACQPEATVSATSVSASNRERPSRPTRSHRAEKARTLTVTLHSRMGMWAEQAVSFRGLDADDADNADSADNAAARERGTAAEDPAATDEVEADTANGNDVLDSAPRPNAGSPAPRPRTISSKPALPPPPPPTTMDPSDAANGRRSAEDAKAPASPSSRRASASSVMSAASNTQQTPTQGPPKHRTGGVKPMMVGRNGTENEVVITAGRDSFRPSKAISSDAFAATGTSSMAGPQDDVERGPPRITSTRLPQVKPMRLVPATERFWYFRTHILTLMWKRFLFFRRDMRMAALQILLPLICVAMGVVLFTVGTESGQNEELTLKLDAFSQGGHADAAGKGSSDFVPKSVETAVSPLFFSNATEANFTVSLLGNRGNLSGQGEVMEHLSVKKGVDALPILALNKALTFDDVSRALFDVAFDSQAFEASMYGAVSFANLVEPTTRTSAAAGAPGNESSIRIYDYLVHGNYTAAHAGPAYAAAVAEAVLRRVHGGYSLTAVLHPMPKTAREQSLETNSDFVSICLFIMLGMTFVSSVYAVMVVLERESGAKFLQIVAGVTVTEFWLASWLFDVLSFVVPGGATMGMLIFFDVSPLVDGDALFACAALLGAYAFSVSGYCYLQTLAFEQHSTAQISVVFSVSMTGIILPLVGFLLRSNVESNGFYTGFLQWIFRVFPAFSFCDGLLALVNRDLYAELELDGQRSYAPFDWEITFYNLLAMAALGPVYFALTVLVDKILNSPEYHALLCTPRVPVDDVQLRQATVMADMDVAAEQERVLSGRANTEGDLIVLKSLQKIYPGGGFLARITNGFMCIPRSCVFLWYGRALFRGEEELGRGTGTGVGPVTSPGGPRSPNYRSGPDNPSPAQNLAHERGGSMSSSGWITGLLPRSSTGGANAGDASGAAGALQSPGRGSFSASSGPSSFPAAQSGGRVRGRGGDGGRRKAGGRSRLGPADRQRSRSLVMYEENSDLFDFGWTHNFAVRGLSLGVARGECFGLLGVNGAGKTTTLKMLTGQTAPRRGDVLVQGKSMFAEKARANGAGQDSANSPTGLRALSCMEVAAAAAARVGDDVDACPNPVGYCPQHNSALFERLTGREHLYLYARLKGVPPALVTQTVDETLEALDLTHVADRVVLVYSGGMKRRLCFGIAVLGDPRALLLDEPSAGCDPVAKRYLWDLITQMRRVREDTLSVVVTTHSMEECEALCSRIGIMVEGQLRCLGTGQHLRNRYGCNFQLDLQMQDASDADIEPVADSIASAADVHLSGHSSEMPITQHAAVLALQATGRTELAKVLSRDAVAEPVSAAEVLVSTFTIQRHVSVHDLACWVVEEQRWSNLVSFLDHKLTGYAIRERHHTKIRLEIPSTNASTGSERRIADLFDLLEQHRTTLRLSYFSIATTSLADIFNAFAKTGAREFDATAHRVPATAAKRRSHRRGRRGDGSHTSSMGNGFGAQTAGTRRSTAMMSLGGSAGGSGTGRAGSVRVLGGRASIGDPLDFRTFV